MDLDNASMLTKIALQEILKTKVYKGVDPPKCIKGGIEYVVLGSVWARRPPGIEGDCLLSSKKDVVLTTFDAGSIISSVLLPIIMDEEESALRGALVGCDG